MPRLRIGRAEELDLIEYLFDSVLMGAAAAQVMSLPEEDVRRWSEPVLAGVAAPAKAAGSAAFLGGLAAPAKVAGSPGSAAFLGGLGGILAGDAVRSGGDIGAGSGVLADADLLPVLPALRELLPGGALQRGSVVAAGGWNLLCLALAAGPVASGAWCAAAGLPQLGVRAAADAGLDPGRLLLIPDLGPNWPQVVASLLDGCDLVLLSPPDRPSAQVRRKLEAAVRRHRAVLLVAGEWDGAQTRLRVTSQEWAGIGTGHGRLRARMAQVVADGRGGWSRPRVRRLWLPGPDGSVTMVADGAALTCATAGTDAGGDLATAWLETSAG